MRDFPKCLGENGVQLGDASCSNMGMHSKSHHNPTTCIYVCKLFNKMSLITLVWSKNLMGQIMLTIQIDDDDTSHNNKSHICRVDVKPTLFSRRKGSKCLDLTSGKIDLFWDLSTAKFGPGSGPEPLEGYYIGVVCEGMMALLIGDLTKEAFKKSSAIASFSSGSLVSKRVHVFGNRVFHTKARFCDQGSIHDVEIEHDTSCGDDMALVVHVDSKMILRVRHLRWKFRGNEMLLVDGMPVEVSWDVHNWLFGPGLGSAIFVFSARLMDERVWESPSQLGLDFSRSIDESKMMGLGFSFFLYAWKNE